MRSAGRVGLLTLILMLGVREAGNPDSDTIAMELRTEVVMTASGPVIVPVLAPAKKARRCSLPTISRPGATENEMLAAVVNRAEECAIQEAIAKPEGRWSEVR